MSSCQTVTTLALEKLGVIAGGSAPETADATRALSSLKSYYQKLINEGACGRLVDVKLPPNVFYDANEGERIVHDGTCTVNLPVELPGYSSDVQYGEVVVGPDYGTVRPPADLSVISVVITEGSDKGVKDYIYDNRVRCWLEITALTPTKEAPLSWRDEDGLASALAIRLASIFSQQIAPEVREAAMQFEEALSYNWSQAGEFIEPRDYF